MIASTPVWVWPLFLVLLAFGLRQTLRQRATIRRVSIVPVVLTGLSMYGTLSAWNSDAQAIVSWLLALVVSATWVGRRPLPRGTQFDLAQQTFSLPGSWVPLALMMGIFFTKYALGAMGALNPTLLNSLPVMLVASALYGLCSGIFLGRAARLWRLASHTDAQWHHGTSAHATAT
ncbi:DUF6622 family protein [Acidovorax sp.]|uniref:DUF6622 family protein n=1 Tax=Acidovorax sp. TaxID=1872122 RepID=UPI002ACD6668|nr:DUF6622 family protein [Acidovorax sp.]MDZ7862232.1 DUF6622 family protein [Acidovorax sp.]